MDDYGESSVQMPPEGLFFGAPVVSPRRQKEKSSSSSSAHVRSASIGHKEPQGFHILKARSNRFSASAAAAFVNQAKARHRKAFRTSRDSSSDEEGGAGEGKKKRSHHDDEEEAPEEKSSVVHAIRNTQDKRRSLQHQLEAQQNADMQTRHEMNKSYFIQNEDMPLGK